MPTKTATPHDNVDDVAIIGGGIAGMALALALNAHAIPATIYESHDAVPLPPPPPPPPHHHAGGGMMLCPNALRILESPGVYELLFDKAYSFDYVYYKDRDEVTVDRYALGGKAAFGYDAVRIFRQELIEILAGACRERARGGEAERRRAGVLVGADGIHSRVRSTYVAPEAKPAFVGLAALTYAVPTAQLRVPEDKDYTFPVSVASGNGVFVLAPQGRDGGEMLAGTQVPFDAEKASLPREALMADKEALKARLRLNEEAWPGLVRSALEGIRDETMNVWPFFMLPALERWASRDGGGRVLVLGDAAHAIPPTTGQGASMALEDAASLALVIGWEEGVEFWQGIRRERLGRLVGLTKMLNNKRLPSDEMAKLPREEVWFEEGEGEGEGQMSWLYVPEIEKRVEEWVERKLQ
ncbi:hypothetical protein BDP81DRAFT_483383 [Colletotrichum phormii]|uniref:FAD-binding domain-containing protein n=1 Tax=Colletotrichum phormii TaxID=359342 RepID=A0AAJ0EB92_9PEZI|nr:uncharacterized protein BDP81DRAFT_483383 [Colletotrichum phormii]KAK1633367.1 hypothetical protein BDP81DRAFT_483383 [Colletotrichum phormii]